MPPHGVRARYQKGCKCAPCRAANAAYDRALRCGRRDHGSTVAARRGCRCEACTLAYSQWAEQLDQKQGSSRVSIEEVSYRLSEIEHLIAGGVWPPEAVHRVGWSTAAAEQAAARHGQYELASRIATTRQQTPIPRP